MTSKTLNGTYGSGYLVSSAGGFTPFTIGAAGTLSATRGIGLHLESGGTVSNAGTIIGARYPTDADFRDGLSLALDRPAITASTLSRLPMTAPNNPGHAAAPRRCHVQ